MRDKPWAAVPLLDDGQEETQWFATEVEALKYAIGKAVDIQYRPGRKPKGKPRS